MIFVLVYFRALKRKPVLCKSDVLFSLFSFSLTLSVFSFSSSIPDIEITENLFTATENVLQKKTFVDLLGLRRNFIGGTKREIPSGQYRPIFPAWVAIRTQNSPHLALSRSLPYNNIEYCDKKSRLKDRMLIGNTYILYYRFPNEDFQRQYS